MTPADIMHRPSADDPLEDVLRRSRARAGAIASLVGRGSWRLRFPAPLGAKFNFVGQGSCWVWTDTTEPTFVDTGDAFLLTRPVPFVIASEREAPEHAASPLFAIHDGTRADVGSTTDPVSAALLGGSFTFSGPTRRLILEALPPIVHVPARSPHAAAVGARVLEMEREVRAARPGARSVAEHLAGVLLVELLRFAIDDDLVDVGLLAGMRDDVAATALRAMHAAPAEPWTVARLAERAAVSRSTLAARFRAATGVGPLAYLTRWRIDLAADQLIHTQRTIAAIADDVGYGSEAALSLAFRREMGVAPGAYRRNAGPQRES